MNALPPSISIAPTVCSGFLVNAIIHPPPPEPVNLTPKLEGAAALMSFSNYGEETPNERKTM